MDIGSGARTPQLAANIERFVRQLVVTYKAVLLYPPASTIPRDNAADTARILAEVFRERAGLTFIVTKTGLILDDEPVFPGQPAFAAFALELYHRSLAEVRFHTGIDAHDIVAFLSIVKIPPEEIAATGGFESRLWELGVDTITIAEAHLAIVDAPLAAELAEEPGEDADVAEVDDLLASAWGASPRDQRVLTRFMSDPVAVRDYLASKMAAEQERKRALAAVAEKFAEMAAIAADQNVEERAELYRSLAQALMRMDADTRRRLLVDRVLPEAKTSDSLASVVRQMDIDELFRVLVADIEPDAASFDGLARAIRNLTTISLASREEILNSAGAAMRGAGIAEPEVVSVLERAAPSRLEVRRVPEGPRPTESACDSIFRLMDLAPMPVREFAGQDPGVAQLVLEARRGITDGDILGTLVSLVALDTREAPFASMMAMLEDSLELLVSRGELDVAAEAGETLIAALENPALTVEQRSRMRRAVERLGDPRSVNAIVQTLRLYPPNTPEHAAAKRLLDVLGPLVIPPLLEQLANEPDMAQRKSMVDLLSILALKHVNSLGHAVSDPRWYVVRNVVNILGNTRSSAALPYLERTLRHPEPRVRRETIRSLSHIPDRLSIEMMVAALTDDDAQNVQLAARYLGRSGERRAASALEEVARGDGRGNRDTGPRVEAIEALGRLGAREAVPTLEALAGKRAVFRQSQTRELRAAAEAAIAHIATVPREEAPQ